MADGGEPTFSANTPLATVSDGRDAAALAAAYFGDPLPWQASVLEDLLARDERDKYEAKVYAIAIPRQNGKSWVVRARCFYGLVVCGEAILFTCQHGDTADEMFKALSAERRSQTGPAFSLCVLRGNTVNSSLVRPSNEQECAVESTRYSPTRS